jgi:hypothetical protein
VSHAAVSAAPSWIGKPVCPRIESRPTRRLMLREWRRRVTTNRRILTDASKQASGPCAVWHTRSGASGRVACRSTRRGPGR